MWFIASNQKVATKIPTIMSLCLGSGYFRGQLAGVPGGIANNMVSVPHLSREQHLLEAKESPIYFLKM